MSHLISRVSVLIVVVIALTGWSAVSWADQEGDKGTMRGRVIEKGEGWVRVKPADGESERFMARCIGGMPADGGGLDKSMVETIAAIPVGAEVRIKWVYEERKRVVEIDIVIEKQPAPTEKN